MAFPITFNSQEEFDGAVSERLGRERAKYADYEALKLKAQQYDELNAKNYPAELQALQMKYDKATADLAEITKRSEEAATTNATTIAELQGKLKSAELTSLKARVGSEAGLPSTIWGRLQGETEEELKADATGFAKYIVPQSFPPAAEPAHDVGGGAAKSTPPTAESARDAALHSLAQSIFGPQRGV